MTFSTFNYAALNFIGDMRNNLNGCAKVATITMLVVAERPPMKANDDSAIFSAYKGRASTH